MKKFCNRLSFLFSQPVRQSVARVFTAVCVISACVMGLYMLAMRFSHLSNGLAYDELYSVITASPQLSFKFIWKEILLKDVNLPLFNVLLLGWNRIFPFTPFWMRLFPALTGLMAVVVAWFCVPAYWTRLKKYIFLTLMSGSFILVAYGRILRTYSLAVLFTVAFSLLALRLIHQFKKGENPSAAQWLLFFTAGLLGAYSHYFCSGLFFITALVVFLYTGFYKVKRLWAFWGTAVVFLLWSPWLVHTLWLMSNSSGGWWFHTPFFKASFDIFVFLFGPNFLFVTILYVAVLAIVSLVSTYKKDILKQADLVLPLAQIIILLGVITLFSIKVNLWLDRYFLPVLVSLLLLFAEFLDHLRKRHLALLVLWPLLLAAWIQFFWTLDYLSLPEYTGLKDAFTRVTQTQKVDKLLVYSKRTGYPAAAVLPMFSFYIPQEADLQLIELTPQNVSLSWQTDPKTYIFVPLCSQMSLVDISVFTRTEPDGTPLLFGDDTCLYTARPLVKKRRIYGKNILSL